MFCLEYCPDKDLPRRTAADKVLCNKALKTTENPKYDGYQCGLTSMAYINFSIKRFQVLLLKKKLCRTSKVGDFVRISEYKTKATLQREVFVIKRNKKNFVMDICY